MPPTPAPDGCYYMGPDRNGTSQCQEGDIAVGAGGYRRLDYHEKGDSYGDGVELDVDSSGTGLSCDYLASLANGYKQHAEDVLMCTDEITNECCKPSFSFETIPPATLSLCIVFGGGLGFGITVLLAFLQPSVFDNAP